LQTSRSNASLKPRMSTGAGSDPARAGTSANIVVDSTSYYCSLLWVAIPKVHRWRIRIRIRIRDAKEP